MNFSNDWTIIIRQSIVMLPLLGSQLQFYQKKSYKLEMEVITLQDELLSLKTSKGDQYKIKYQMLLDRIAEQNQLKQSKRNQSFIQQEKTINEINQKWEQVLNQKISDFNIQLESLTLEKTSLKNKAIELELKCIKLQKVIDDGDSQVLAIKLESVKKDNERLRKDNDDLYRSRMEAVDKIERQSELKIQAVKEREKTFYREQIEVLQKRIEQTEVILQSQRQKISPEREKLIISLQNEIRLLKIQHDQELMKLTQVIEKKNRQIKSIQQEREALDKSNFDLMSDMNNQIKNLEEKIFRFEDERIMQIKAIQMQMSKIRQQEADDLKKQFQKMKNEFDEERQQWKRIAEQANDTGNNKQKDYEEQKQRFLQQKNRLKTKITELKIRLKEKEEQKGNGQTQLLIKSLRQMNNNEAHFNNYQDAITFMDRQVRKASLKIEQKNRQISNLLQELRTLQAETQLEVKDVKQKSKNQQKRLYDKLFALQEQVDEIQQKLREKEKYIRKKQADLSQQKQGHQIEVQNLKKIIQQMERDYKRLTGNKKSIEQSYRQERQNVISGKLDVNQQRKKKWTDLIRQRNQLEIVYREREMQIKADHEVQIDKLKRQRQRLIEQREQYKADAQLLRERLNQSNQENKENRIVDYQNKLATLDLQIALTQNLFSTLSNATAKKGQNIGAQLEQMSQDKSSKVGSSHSFQLKTSNMAPLFIEGEIPRQDLYRTGAFSFTPFNLKK